MSFTEELLRRLSLVNGKDDCNCSVAGNSQETAEHDEYCAYRLCSDAAGEIKSWQERYEHLRQISHFQPCSRPAVETLKTDANAIGGSQ